MVARNKAYIILTTAFGIGVGVFSASTTLLGQIVNAQGYSDVSGLIKEKLIRRDRSREKSSL